MIFTFILLFISIMLGQTFTYNFLRMEDNIEINIISMVLVILVFIIGSYYTFNPIYNKYFWDPKNKTYERVIKK